MIKKILITFLGLAFVSNYWILIRVYPNVSEDWNEFLQFVSTRNKVYEAMFALFFLLTYMISDKFTKAVACFFLIMSGSSFIDKTFFNIHRPLMSDVALLIISSILSYAVYARENK